MKIAIIGAGISGMGSAYLLSQEHDVTLFEKNDYIGGHSRTIDVTKSDNDTMPVDTGFIVFNDWNYPHLMGLFDALGVAYEKSDMSFGVSIKNGWLEYSSNNLLAQKRNLLRPSFYSMIGDILKFNKQALAFIDQDNTISLQECLNKIRVGTWFRQYYLLAMGAAIWSCPIDTIMKFPAKTFLQFFKNHGLLSVNNRPQWYTVTGGSREYVAKILAQAAFTHQFNAVKTVCRKDDKVQITLADGSIEIFDQAVFACHADEALMLMDQPTHDEKKILGNFKYQSNHIIVHRDDSFMPRNKDCWASWVYLSEETTDQKQAVSLSYWMNNLQNLDPTEPVFVTLNPDRRPNANMIIDEHDFTHPIFDQKAIDAQKLIPTIQGINRFWFCGAYQRYGFHEDGLWSAVNIAKKLGADIPWGK